MMVVTTRIGPHFRWTLIVNNPRIGIPLNFLFPLDFVEPGLFGLNKILRIVELSRGIRSRIWNLSHVGRASQCFTGRRVEAGGS